MYTEFTFQAPPWDGDSALERSGEDGMDQIIYNYVMECFSLWL